MRALFLVLIAPWMLTAIEGQTPPVFSSSDFADAKARATTEQRILILDAMTSWCGPCKRMDQTTWIDPELVGWISKHGLAIQLDMDQHEALKEQLAIRAYPTIIAFKNGIEFDRLVGYRDATAMRTWLSDVARDRTELDRVREELSTLGQGSEHHARRTQLAEQLVDYREDAPAFEQCRWLWSRADERLRWGPIAAMLRGLCERHEDYGSEMSSVRDELTPSVADGTASVAGTRDWIELCGVIGDEARIVRWADESLRKEGGRDRVRALDRRLFSLLIDHGRWELAGSVLTNPLTRMEEMGRSLGAYDRPVAPTEARPAIPLMAPAKRADAEPSRERESKPVEAAAPKTLPAIPIGGGRPKKAESTGEGETSQADDGAAPRAIPAIPLMMRPARPAEESDRAGESEADALARDIRERLTYQFETEGRDFFGALLAAGRDVEADGVAGLLLRFDDSAAARIELVRGAISAGCLELRR
ncbi:MAG: thioredoxin family protein, partial [Planctomycetes bacterium]|nr:thioredoxin family protein [Planctomycetota bacterium]